MPTLDSDTLLVRAWPGASHPSPALAAMAALITGPRTEPTQRDWLAASFDRQTRLTVVRQWPEGRPVAGGSRPTGLLARGGGRRGPPWPTVVQHRLAAPAWPAGLPRAWAMGVAAACACGSASCG